MLVSVSSLLYVNALKQRLVIIFVDFFIHVGLPEKCFRKPVSHTHQITETVWYIKFIESWTLENVTLWNHIGRISEYTDLKHSGHCMSLLKFSQLS